MIKLPRYWKTTLILCLFVIAAIIGWTIGEFTTHATAQITDWEVPITWDFLYQHPLYKTGNHHNKADMRQSARTEIARLIVRKASGLSPYDCNCNQ